MEAKKKILLTEFQARIIRRNAKIVREYNLTTGSTIQRYDAVAKRNGVCRSTVQVVVAAASGKHYYKKRR